MFAVAVGRRTAFSPCHVEETPLARTQRRNVLRSRKVHAADRDHPYVSVLGSEKSNDREEFVRKWRVET